MVQDNTRKSNIEIKYCQVNYLCLIITLIQWEAIDYW